MESKFSVEKKDLIELANIQLTAEEKRKLLDNSGGIEHLIAALKTDQEHGLNTNDAVELKARIFQFGQNQLGQKTAKSFIHFVWIAFNDKLLMALTVCAIISFILSYFFHPNKCECKVNDESLSDKTPG